MEILLNDEQQLFRDSAVTFMERSAGPDALRTARDGDGSVNRALWSEIAEAGWLAVLASEEGGGLGLGLTELCLILEQAGLALMTAPVGAAAIAASALANEENTADLAASVISGDKLIVPAFQETVVGIDLDLVETTGVAEGDGLRVNGKKVAVPVIGADGYLVNAATPSGMVLCHVPAGASGLVESTDRMVDGGGGAGLVFENVAVGASDIVAGANSAPEIIGRMRRELVVTASAELLGVMDRAHQISVDYLKTRNQFGKAIGSFQALQHRAVDDYIAVELTRSLLFQVCERADDGNDITALASALKAKASSASLAIVKSALQFHGAIGFTDEHDIGLYFKRAMVLAARFGNDAAQRRQFVDLTLGETG